MCMKYCRGLVPKLAIAAAVMVGCPLSQSEALAAEASIEVDCNRKGHAISPRLVGLFFEDINFGADGGFSAELVINGSLEVPVDLLGWSQVGEGVTIETQRESPWRTHNPTFLRLVAESDNAAGGAENQGYRGMGVKRGERYRFTAQARCSADQSAKLLVRLIAEDGTPVVEQKATVGGSVWKPVELELKPTATVAKARLQLLLAAEGSIDLDMISLCPTDTWKGRPHGMRKDLVQLLADVKPAFFRFPGGCIVEGSQLKYRYQWKSTIGPRDERRLLVNRWNSEFGHRPTPDYYQSFDVGFYEYFLLAEDIGAEPMPILNCGMACQFNTGELVPLEELEPYIQDALDLIEFANGPVDSTWGSERAAMGHPEPFGMRLLGVGNEQWGPEYFERYRKFAEVLQAEHPEIELISTSGPFPAGERFDYAWPILKQLNVPIVDEHCYATPDWFMREATRYDKYDRQGPKVFMGEYATQSVQLVCPQNRNTLRCALAEAAFLTGIERNSDIVTMSAYAPLMAHEEAWQWRPNLIWFDNLESYGSPSYYTQMLYSHHRGDFTRAVEVTDKRPGRKPGGRIGVGSVDASVEYRQIKFEHQGKVLFDQSSGAGLDSLQKVGLRSNWTVGPELISQTSRQGYARAMMGDFSWGDGTLTLQARRVAGRGNLMVLLRNTDGGSRIEWNIGMPHGKHQLLSRQGTHWDVPKVADEQPGNLETGRWYNIRIELAGDTVTCYLDGEKVHAGEMPDPYIARLFATASFDEQQGETVLKVVNAAAEAVETEIDLAGAANETKTYKAIALTHDDPEAENSIEAPTKVAPQESEHSLEASNFKHTFPAYSFTVLRIDTGE